MWHVWGEGIRGLMGGGGRKKRAPMEDLGVNGRVISQWISEKWAVRAWGWIFLWVGTIGGFL